MRASSVRRSPWHVAVNVFSLSAAAALTAAAFARIEALPPFSWLPLLMLAAIAGWAFADLASGLVHFACDRFGRDDTPLLGPAVIRPFREHHRDPREITRHGFVELSGNNALALTPLLAASGALAPWFGEALLPSAAFAWGMSASLGLLITNQIHRWAHMQRPPRLARLLQRLQLAISAEAHARHHAGAHDVAFCITNNWCNAWLDRARVWARAEGAVRALAKRRAEANGGAASANDTDAENA